MKKIKILRIIILVLLIMRLFGTVVGYYIQFQNNQSIFGSYMSVIHFMFLLCSITGLFFLIFALSSVIKNGFFNTIAAEKFKMSGVFLFILGSGQLVFNSTGLIKQTIENHGYFILGIEKGFILITIAFGLFIVSEFIKNGSVLKQENELTI